MDKAEALRARNALFQAVYILRHTPVEKLGQAYEILTGSKLEDARMKIHAGIYEQLYSMIIDDINERYGQWQDSAETQTDSSQAGLA